MIHCGDLFDVLPTIADASIDACVTDPPYGIGFMGKEWDTFAPAQVAATAERLRRKNTEYTPSEAWPTKASKTDRQKGGAPLEYDYSARGLAEFQKWTERWSREVFRVLKPGAYIVVCGAPRAHHRMMCGLEDAGFEIRDCFAWLFGSGFPKNYNLGDGKGTALKPANEPIALAWKPFKGTIKACHEKHGTAALNIDACRLECAPFSTTHGTAEAEGYRLHKRADKNFESHELGRWPANVVMDDVAAAALDEQTGELVSGSYSGIRNTDKTRGVYGAFQCTKEERPHEGSIGGASRFYYVAKPSREERDMGCYDMQPRQRDDSRKEGNPGGDNPRNRGLQPRGNYHPTVKPVELMRWLVRLVTPVGGRVLDPFGGSFTTAMACVYENRDFTIIEKEREYVEIGVRRVRAVAPLLTDAEALRIRHFQSAEAV